MHRKEIDIAQIHIIPFDIGCVFFDCLSINNSKNLEFAKIFNDNLSKENIQCYIKNEKIYYYCTK